MAGYIFDQRVVQYSSHKSIFLKQLEKIGNMALINVGFETISFLLRISY